LSDFGILGIQGNFIRFAGQPDLQAVQDSPLRQRYTIFDREEISLVREVCGPCLLKLTSNVLIC